MTDNRTSKSSATQETMMPATVESIPNFERRVAMLRMSRNDNEPLQQEARRNAYEGLNDAQYKLVYDHAVLAESEAFFRRSYLGRDLGDANASPLR